MISTAARMGIAALAFASLVSGPGSAQGLPPAPQPGITENTAAWVAGLSPTSQLSMRTGPGTGFGRIAALPLGTEIRILARLGDWVFVQAGGMTGFVSNRYVTTVAPPPMPGGLAPAPVPVPPVRP